ncbi:N-acetylglucosamine-6-phosphate deacetylase [Microbacterium sp. Root61]|uniref:N-acetylglucosamine-6-phosphate deacetylase n=1 Tax=Microbacterium sp. Root61 TaxID=1736570 RepID=UPI002E1593CA
MDPEGVVPDSWIVMAGNRIRARGTGPSWRAHVSSPADVVDACGAYLTAGFIDLHCHGGGGSSVTGDLDTVIETHSRHGTTRLIASLVSAPIPVLCDQLAAIARRAASDPRVLGSHLEGPFLANGYCGAHDPSALVDATDRDVLALLEAAAGTLLQVTLAPERPGARAALDAMRAAGVTVAVGHTASNFNEAQQAFEAGASILTHAFNGMPVMHHRDPGPLLAAIGSPTCVIEVISDGVHVHAEMVSFLFRSAPGRVAIITDAMAAAGAGDGTYELGALLVEVRDGIARLATGGSIAGSTLTMDAALRHTVHLCGVPLPAAIASMTSIPARAIDRQDLGRLSPGHLADAVLLTRDLIVSAVWANGERVRMLPEMGVGDAK